MKFLLRAAAITVLLACPALAQPALEQANQLELKGDFKQAAEVLQKASQAPSLTPAQKKQLAFELDRLRRIKMDFPYTRAELFDVLKKSVRGLTKDEFGRWVEAGRFDSRIIDGQRYFMTSSLGNLFFRYPELEPRRVPPKDTSERQKLNWETCVAIKNAARAEGKHYVLPKRFEATMTVTAKPNAAPEGQTVRAWLPVPRQYPFQDAFDLLSTSSEVKHLEAADSPIRSLLLEQPAHRDKPTTFQVRYDYTVHGVWFDIDPASVKATDPADSALKKFTMEGPHVVFSPEIRKLSQQLAGAETNPYRKAKAFYDWISGNIKYSYSIEYSTIRNISEYCRSHGYGDCGQEALLLITLCRLNGIPARWQSGWSTFPGAKSIHDWTEIYLAPYGWMPVDPYMGIFSMRYSNSLTPEQRREMRDFYFGGLDQYRMIANSDHNQVLRPDKDSMRSDNVDFQRGELEWDGHNIYFDEFTYDLKIKEIKLPRQVE